MKKILLALLVSLGLQTQAQQAAPYFCCDSITYWTDQGQGLFIGLDTTNIVHNPDSMQVYWGVCTGLCTGGMCYSGDGISDYFPQVTTSDTIKVTYDVYIYENGSVEVCNREDWLVYDGTNWVLLNMLPTSLPGFVIEEDGVRWWNDKIYDLQGRELKEIPVGKMYIREGKLFINN